jgi:NIPSNAP protein
MTFNRMLGIATGCAFCAAIAFVLGAAAADKPAQTANRYFEMRTYHAPEGKLDALNARFRDHTTALFKKHGMENIGYWTPADGQPGAGNTLVYILAYPSKEAAEASWKSFRADPEWIKAKTESERDGKLVEKVDQLFMTPTDYSPIK